jgi:hypothetical protein
MDANGSLKAENERLKALADVRLTAMEASDAELEATRQQAKRVEAEALELAITADQHKAQRDADRARLTAAETVVDSLRRVLAAFDAATVGQGHDHV